MIDPDNSSDLSSPPSTLIPERLTVLERYGIHPGLFVFVTLLAVFILYQVVGGLIVLLFFGMSPNSGNVSGFRVATGAGQVVFILLPTLLLLRLATFKTSDYVRLRPPRPVLVLYALAGIFSLQQLLQIYMVFQDRFPIPPQLQNAFDQYRKIIEESTRLLLQSSSLPELGWVILTIAVIPAVAEEFLFRGLVMRSLERSMGGLRAAMFTGIVFGAYHINPFSVVPLMVLGVYLGFLALRSDSLWLSVIIHFFNNAIACIVVYYNLGDDSIVTGDPATMSLPLLLGTAWFFGIVFYLSVHLFLRATRSGREDLPGAPEMDAEP